MRAARTKAALASDGAMAGTVPVTPFETRCAFGASITDAVVRHRCLGGVFALDCTGCCLLEPAVEAQAAIRE